MSRSSVTRRHVLSSLGISATAGCLERLPFVSESGIRLGSLRIANTTDEPHTVDIRIERDNEFVYQDSSEIDGSEAVWIDPIWPSEPARYDFYYTISGRDKVQVAYLTDIHEKDSEGDCLFADLWIVDEAEGILSVEDVAEQEEAICNF